MNYVKWIVVLLLGATAGFSYWYFVGCNSGSCAITSSPVNSSIYGSVMAALVLYSFRREAKDNQK